MPSIGYTVPGEGWIDAFYGWFPAPQWMEIRTSEPLQVEAHRQPEPVFTGTPAERADPTFFPDLGETCFLRPDGEIVCVPTGSIYEHERRDSGYVEIPAGETDVQPEILTEPPRLPYQEIPTDVEISVFEPETEGTPVAIDWGQVVDFGTDVLSDWINPAVTPIYNFAGPSPVQTLPPYLNPSTLTSGTVKCDPRTGKPYRRRRRRPLLTPTDLNTLAALKTITGNNDALKFAVMKAVRR